MELNPARFEIRAAQRKRKRKFKPTKTDLAATLEKTKKNLDEGDLEGPTTETVELEPVEKETEEPESEEGK